MKKIGNYSVVLFVITIILLLIIPLPASIVDVAIILNISLSMMILVITMTIREPLEFSIFPSLLLITTLFRLGINVSTTRNILRNSGVSGKVIAAFGDFILGGNVVVGMIIFLIIVLMQFIVITKGAERVSEVAARFTLDAMPGKQMAIDADLSSGLINEQQAKEQRGKIQREADFYGAMDGATKIVKGDAVMSLITTAINLIGGSIIGIVQSGESIGTVLTTYSIATVGDGLVSQIPALLISTATGMIVTRAVSEGSLNEDVSHQFTAQPPCHYDQWSGGPDHGSDSWYAKGFHVYHCRRSDRRRILYFHKDPGGAVLVCCIPLWDGKRSRRCWTRFGRSGGSPVSCIGRGLL